MASEKRKLSNRIVSKAILWSGTPYVHTSSLDILKLFIIETFSLFLWSAPASAISSIRRKLTNWCSTCSHYINTITHDYYNVFFYWLERKKNISSRSSCSGTASKPTKRLLVRSQYKQTEEYLMELVLLDWRTHTCVSRHISMHVVDYRCFNNQLLLFEWTNALIHSYKSQKNVPLSNKRYIYRV